MRKNLMFLFILVFASLTGQNAFAQDTSFTIRTITLKGEPAYDMKVSPDGRIAAVYVGQWAANLLNISYTEYVPNPMLLPIRLIDLTTGDDLGWLFGATDYATDVAFTPDGKQLASSHRNGDIILWDVSTKKQVKRLTSILGGAGKLKFLPDGKTLLDKIQVGQTGDFLWWDIETGAITKIWHTPYTSYGQVKSTPPDSMAANYVFDVSPDGKLLATASYTGEVALWDMATFQQTVLKKAPEDSAERLKTLLGIPSMTFNADGTLLVYFDLIQGQTHFWDVASHTETKTLSVGTRFWGLSPRGDALAWAARSPNEIRYVKVDQPDQSVKVMDVPDNLMAGPTLTFSPDGSQIVVGGFATKDGGLDNVIFVITLKGA